MLTVPLCIPKPTHISLLEERMPTLTANIKKSSPRESSCTSSCWHSGSPCRSVGTCIYFRAAGCRSFQRGSYQEALILGPVPALTCNFTLATSCAPPLNKQDFLSQLRTAPRPESPHNPSKITSCNSEDCRLPRVLTAVPLASCSDMTESPGRDSLCVCLDLLDQGGFSLRAYSVCGRRRTYGNTQLQRRPLLL